MSQSTRKYARDTGNKPKEPLFLSRGFYKKAKYYIGKVGGVFFLKILLITFVYLLGDREVFPLCLFAP